MFSWLPTPFPKRRTSTTKPLNIPSKRWAQSKTKPWLAWIRWALTKYNLSKYDRPKKLSVDNEQLIFDIFFFFSLYFTHVKADSTGCHPSGRRHTAQVSWRLFGESFRQDAHRPDAWLYWKVAQLFAADGDVRWGAHRRLATHPAPVRQSNHHQTHLQHKQTNLWHHIQTTVLFACAIWEDNWEVERS